jgi:tetratricopeptide (TPR) repeat protein
MLAKGRCVAAKLYLNNLLETSKINLKSAQVLALTYDYCGVGSPEATKELMDRILTFEPNHAQALLIKGNLAYEEGEYDAAFDLYSHAQQVNPLEPRAYLGMAQIQAARGHLDTAAQLIEQALEINSEHKGARALLKQIKSRSFSPVPQGR